MTSETLNRAAAAAHKELPDMGFILIVTPFGDGETAEVQANYVSNCNRQDVVKILKTLLFRWGINEEWMREAK